MHIYWIEATKSGAKYGENLVQNMVKFYCRYWTALSVSENKSNI